MIKTLLIKHFQSHENTCLEFDKGVNIIVGSSDSGKTAIIRALRWLKDNRPSGDAMRSNWCGKDNNTVVKIWATDPRFEDEHTSREIVKGENIYHLHAQTFKAFGTSVPDEVSRFINMSDINIQMQLDSPFLLSETPGAVAQHFNKVAKLDKIDTAIQNINSWIRELTSTIRYDESQETKLKEDITKFEHLEKFEAEVEVLEDMDKQLLVLRNQHTKLCTIHNNILINEEQTLAYQSDLALEKPLDNIFKLKDQKEDLEIDGGDLWNNIEDIQKLQTEITEQETILELEPYINNLLTLHNKLKSQNTTKISLFKLLSTINNTNTKLEEAKGSYSRLKAKFEKAMPVGSTCILCGQIIKR